MSKAKRDVLWWASVATILALFVGIMTWIWPDPLNRSVTDTPSAKEPPTSTPRAREATPTPRTYDVYDDFSSSAPSKWGTVEGSISPVIENGSLQLNYTSTGEYGGGGLHINNENKQLKLVATELTVRSAKAKSFTFIQVFLGVIDGQPWYAHFGVMDTGELFYASAPVGESPKDVEATWPSMGLGEPNVLVVEWTSEDVLFYANNQLLKEVKAKDGGWWVIFGVGAEGNGSSINEFDWAGWSYRR